ncbi:Glycosyltransferase [Gracilibacillus halophilus YIM-C55.5]|uniref:Glycosyltransferase n=1 Tax=Gracilibacillus halophilus YIM-C55.5 TaxID=1308866 RepID=N4WU27_9BACI|nr:glycosyltransferase family 2 protein [Gracilibacillus halophilus]ENH96606.1 Glycosyltransferase [Gracilibacillus halophilus YIM-C55.5]
MESIKRLWKKFQNREGSNVRNDYKVTVLMPFYNPNRQFIKEAIETVFDQTYENWELLLVDDGSTEPYREAIQPFLNDQRVRLIQLEKNMGQSKAMNQGLQQIQTPYLIQLDSDDWFYPHTLEVLMHAARKQTADVAVISGNIQIIHEDANGNRLMTEVYKGRLFKDKYDFMLANTSVWPRFYRTDALKSVGGWPTDDPHEGRYLEDKRVLHRLIEKYRFYWLDQMLYMHRRHPNNHTNQIDKYAETEEWTIRNSLKRWGDEYEPKITTFGKGWKKLDYLIRKTDGAIRKNTPPIVEQVPTPQPSTNTKPVNNQTTPSTSTSQPNRDVNPLGTAPNTGPGTAPGTGPGT